MKSEHGIATQFKAMHINKLGVFDPTGSAAEQPKWHDVLDAGEKTEFYMNGDYCYPSQDK